MSVFTPPPEPTGLQFRVELRHIKPKIWRSIQVPPDASMWDLHVAIQDAMGWKDCHLHEFRVETDAGTVSIGIPTEDDFKPVTPGWEIPVVLMFRKVRTEIRYAYDFGDDWDHAVTLEKVIMNGKALTKPCCVAGERACPPEDCGGVPGYMNLLKVLGKPKHPEYDEMRQWAGDFEPERFDPNKVKFDDPDKRLKMMVEG